MHGDNGVIHEELTAIIAPDKRNKKFNKTTPLKLGCWNVRTMTPGLNENLQDISDTRKTAIINNELLRLQVDIVTLQETRLAGSGTLKEKDYTFFWQGKPAEDLREYGVGFAVRNSLLKSVEPGNNGSERLLTLRLHTSSGPASLISVYAPTLSSTPEAKDEFYNNLDAVIKCIPSDEHLLLLGDFNARVGADHESWPSCLGHFGVGKINDNGQRLLELCSYHDLCVTNSFFKTKPQHKVSWRHPRSKHWHQLDLIITRRSFINAILLTRSYHSADCDTDHALVCCKIRLQPKRMHRSKQAGKPSINVTTMQLKKKVEEFAESFEASLGAAGPLGDTATEKWIHLREAIQSSAFSTFGRKSKQNSDWFVAKSSLLMPVIEAKRTAFSEYKSTPSTHNLKVLQAARSAVQRMARQCANEYWLQLSEEIQTASATGNIRSMYDGIKKALGPSQCKTAPLKSSSGEVITDRSKQMDRWVEHFFELYSTENVVTTSALDNILSLPIMDALDAVPTVDELNKAIDSLTSGKAPGNDGIPPDLIKCCKSALLQPLHEVLCQCWEEGAVPQDMRDSKIITLYKNKGARSDCNNYRGISLLSVVGKVFARVVLMRLQVLAERVYPESQCGFRAGRSTIDMIFSIRQLQEKCREQQKPLYIAFIDLTKAFDLVSRSGLFQILLKIGCPPRLLSIIRSFHTDMKATVQYNSNLSEPFDIRSGVKQGCVLAPTLFGIFFSVLLKQAFGSATEGIYMYTRSDGQLFKPARLRAKTKVRKILIRDMLFADDAAITSHSKQELQRLMDRFSQACKDFGLVISLKKTNVLAQGVQEPPVITIDDTALDVVQDFTYLGSTISDSLSLDAEINKRIGKAATTLARLAPRVWENPKLTIKTKAAVYNACVISTLLYGSETWTTYSRHEKKLNSFHLRCIRHILGVTWKDKVSNSELLSRTGLPTMYTLLRQRRLRWLGHVRRMEDGRLPKDIMYGELMTGKRNVGRPQLRYKDICKRDMTTLNFNTECWEQLADNRHAWRSTVKQHLELGEEQILSQFEKQRAKRKIQRSTHIQPDTSHLCSTCGRDCHSRIGLFSHRRRCSPNQRRFIHGR